MREEQEIDPQKIVARVVKGLVKMRGAVAQLHMASVDRHHQDMRSALNTIDSEYFVLREYLAQLKGQARQSAE